MGQKRYECEKVGLIFFDNAPLKFSFDIFIPASPDELFRCFEDSGSWPQWVGAISFAEWTSVKPYGIGATRSVGLPGGMLAHEEFIAWDRGKHMAFRFNQFSHRSVTAFAENYQVTDLGNGRCKLRWTIAMQQRGIARLLSSLMRPFLSWYLHRMINGIADYMDQHGHLYRTEKPPYSNKAA